MFSKACEYGIKAMLFIAQKDKESKRISLKDIAGEIHSPEAFTAKILQKLSRQGLLQSMKGPAGGFVLGSPAQKISLADIVSAIDGDSIYKGCALGLEQCSEEKPCPLHWKFKAIRDDLGNMLEETSLAETSEYLIAGITFLKR